MGKKKRETFEGWSERIDSFRIFISFVLSFSVE